ncbi:glycosyltransferase [Alkalihalobacillus sp. BA299]|uniref:glycosyltransferase n=1 Tax=Alkalihalobacillus sp. BA299 TaxID=2815938 RepID=UPI001ADB1A71|nr:glycosyltransferase [Alkalihalobacillus sp. BA299]
MKKICIVTTVSMTLKAFVVDAAKYLHENGNYDITLICDYDESFEKTLPDYIKYIPVSMKRGISLSAISSILRLYVIFKKEKYDLVQYSTPNASCYASIAAKLAGIPVRLYCQWGLVYVGFSGIKKRLFKEIEKMVCSLSTWIEPDSFGNLRFSHLEGLYTKEKSSVVWNGSASGVNLQKFNIEHKSKWREEIRNKYGISNNVFVIGFVGRITRDKGINELFFACRSIFAKEKNIVLMLIGDNENTESLNEELFQWSKKEERVVYCGRTSEVEKYLSAIDVFVLPSYREGFGSVVIEAEAMGVPVIVTDIPGPKDAMENNGTGLIVKKADWQDLSESIEKLLNNKELYSLMSMNARNFVVEKFDQRTLFKYIQEDRKKLLNSKTI